MKNILIALIAFSSLSVFAHEIEGTLPLKGTLKTEIRVNNIKTVCKMSIGKVKNLLEEDQFGNPAYKIEVGVSLSGGEIFSSKRVKFSQDLTMTNMFADGVRDLEYQGKGVLLKITDEGRFDSARINTPYGVVSCKF